MLSLTQIALISKKFKCPVNDIRIDINRNDCLDIYRYTKINNPSSPIPDRTTLLWSYAKESDVIIYYGMNGPEYYDIHDIWDEITETDLKLVWRIKRYR